MWVNCSSFVAPGTPAESKDKKDVAQKPRHHAALASARPLTPAANPAATAASAVAREPSRAAVRWLFATASSSVCRASTNCVSAVVTVPSLVYCVQWLTPPSAPAATLRLAHTPEVSGVHRNVSGAAPPAGAVTTAASRPVAPAGSAALMKSWKRTSPPSASVRFTNSVAEASTRRMSTAASAAGGAGAMDSEPSGCRLSHCHTSVRPTSARSAAVAPPAPGGTTAVTMAPSSPLPR